jgi:ribose transport system ATP-binding protein
VQLGDGVGLQPNDPAAPIETLSGGNQQKVVMARWMRIGGSVLALEDPTAGVDVGAKAEIYRLLADAVGRGLAVLLIATDFEEVAEICHRALVFRNGRIVAELKGASLTHEQLVHAASLAGDSHQKGARVH